MYSTPDAVGDSATQQAMLPTEVPVHHEEMGVLGREIISEAGVGGLRPVQRCGCTYCCPTKHSHMRAHGGVLCV